jgi:putative CocE/NonD family hydrolase
MCALATRESRVLLRFLALVWLVAWLPPAGATEEFDSVHRTTQMVAMRDGVRLATDVYRPARGGQPVETRFPVLIYRSPYNKDGNRKSAIYFAQHGYVVLAQDCRGRFVSEGAFYPFVNEGRDGYDTIEWAAAQPWSNGKVGTLGASYLAWDQYLAAMERPPHLVAMFANVAGANFYRESAYRGGAPGLGWPIWILYMARTSSEAAHDPPAASELTAVFDDPRSWLGRHPQLRAESFQKFPAYRRMYEDFYSHPDFDQYWRQTAFHIAGHYRRMKDVPVFFISGWYDSFVEGVLENYAALSRLHKSAQKLWVGPWPHAIGGATCGDAAFGAQAAVREDELALDWFDRWLKGRGFRVIGAEPVRIFRMGGGDGGRTFEGKLNHGGEWLALDTWPPPAARPARYYLRDSGSLSPTAPGREEPSSLAFDPERPVPTIGGRYGLPPWTPSGPQDQRCSPKIFGCEGSAPLKERDDVLSFSTAPLQGPVDVIGKVSATLWISSDAVDTDFAAKLTDVYPDGYALILADGQLRARYRTSFERPELMKPGKTCRLAVDLGSVANRFAVGHRIRVDVSSSNYPKFEPNPNTGEPPDRWTRRVKTRNTVYHHAGRASYVELPIMVATKEQ